GRELVGLEDDLLAAEADDTGGQLVLVGEGALMAALARERTGYMADIVATIQRDQDEIIRAPMKSTLVVTGGPGTGKTVVALHRAAYLLYTHRERIANNGVLFVGPSNLFLRYVERVLPSLGESSVMMIDWAELLPDITGVPESNPLAADVKGSLSMIDVLRRAVRFFERVPAAGVRIIGPDGESMKLPSEALKQFRKDARAGDATHNRGRTKFEASLVRFAQLPQLDDIGYHDVSHRSIRKVVDRLWPALRPAQVLAALYSNERLLTTATAGVLDPGAQQILQRSPESPWTTSDLPLLDELRLLLGDLPRRKHDQSAERRAAELQDAEQGLRDLSASMAQTGGGGGISIDAIVNAEAMLDRYAAPQVIESIAEQARRDPTWKFAHIVVDEAQDVSPMQWRALARRCQSKSMTIVGDPDQMSRPSAEPWIERITTALDIDRCDEHTLHVNYRTPEALVQPARLLRSTQADIGGGVPTRYARVGDTPWAMRCDVVDESSLRAAIERATAGLGDRGRLAVISSSRDRDLVTRVVSPETSGSDAHGAARLTQSVAAYLASEVKGLEFDAVVVVDPEAIVTELGWRQLYVVLTRPTRHLGMLVAGEPADFEQRWIDEGAVALADDGRAGVSSA
ncbi:MAG: HelD family protein, partial [Ilumatobacteraceae bacterium]